MQPVQVILCGKRDAANSAFLRMFIGDDTPVSELADVRDVLRRMAAQPFGIVLIDLRQLGRKGYGCAREISSACPGAQVLLLGGERSYEEVRRAMASGAAGFFPYEEQSAEALQQEWTRIVERLRALERWRRETPENSEAGRGCDASHSAATESAMEFVRRNYRSNISFADAAAHAGVSESHLRRRFKAETGRNFVDYLTDVRIDEAKCMMESGETRTNVIGMRVGFSSTRYFCSVFKKMTGMTPGEYIRLMGKGED